VILLIFVFFATEVFGRFGAGEKYKEYLYKKYPGLRESDQRRDELNEQLASSFQKRDTQTVWTIPVVVHIIYNDSAQNIPDSVIFNQIATMNKDYRKLNSDLNKVIHQFGSFPTDTGIQFILATTDPNGNPTNGITRTSTPIAQFPGLDDDDFQDACKYTELGGIDGWNSSNYMNIWVCYMIGDVLGYTTTSPPDEDGVLIVSPYFGTNPAWDQAPYNLGRTLTHEMGHWFSLIHPWGTGADNQNCQADDSVADTPKENGPSYYCLLNKTTCNDLNMVQNYMDYSDDDCMQIFTPDQTARMRRELPDGSVKSRKMAFNYTGFVLGISSTTSTTDGTTSSSTLTFDSNGNSNVIGLMLTIMLLICCISF